MVPKEHLQLNTVMFSFNIEKLTPAPKINRNDNIMLVDITLNGHGFQKENLNIRNHKSIFFFYNIILLSYEFHDYS